MNEGFNNENCVICQAHTVKNGKLLRTAKDAVVYLEHVRHKKQEYLVCLSLDSGSRVITVRIVTIGTLTSSLVHPREVYAGPLSDRAASIIVAHNHPSGDPSPSENDIETTHMLASAGELLGIPLDDHIIISAKKLFSFKENSMIATVGI